MAIDPKELRIGSHILVNGVRVEIECITNNSQIGYYLPNYDDWEACSPDRDWVEPIPTTEELLTEEGFVKDEVPTYPIITIRFIDAESAKYKVTQDMLVLPRIAIQYIETPNPYWIADVYDGYTVYNRMDIRYLHELEAFLYLINKNELIKE